jgi:hypothetical protein
MAGGGGDGEEADYWPGYVDALTAMVKVLAFVMMLLAVAVFVLSQNTSRQMVQQVAEAAVVKPQEGATVEQIAQQVRQKISEIQSAPPRPPSTSTEQVPETKVESKATDTLVEQKPVAAVAAGARFVVTFPDRVTRVDPEAIGKLGEFVKPMAGTGRRFLIVAYADLSVSALTEARRIAYFRAMQLRGQILAAGFPGENLAIQVQDVNDAERGRLAEVVAQ